MEHDNETIDPEGFLLVNDAWEPSNFTGKVKHSGFAFTGYKAWYKNNKLHREDGPAIEYDDGDRHWYKNNELHRDDGPAVEYADGHTEWYYDGKEGFENFPPDIKKKLARRFLHGA